MNLRFWRRKESAVAYERTGYGMSSIFARWSVRRYEQIVEQAYQRNVIAFRATQYLATAVGQVPIEVYYRGEKVEGFTGTDVGHHVKRLMRRPNPRASKNSFMERAMGFRILSGNTYFEGVDGSEDRNPQELYVLRPDRIKIVVRPDGMGLGSYQYEYPGKTRADEVWPIDLVTGYSQVLHLKTFNPADELYGQSSFMAAMQAVDQHNASSTWNQALLQNMGVPSAAMKYKRNSMTPKTEDRLKQELDEVFGAGPSTARRPLLYSDDIEWQQLSLNPVDMDWLNGKHTSARDICNGVGVPPMLIGIPGDNTYSNYKEARLAMYEETVVPETNAMYAGLSFWFSDTYDDEIELRPDWDQVMALAPRREALWERIANAEHLSLNEKRKLTGFDDKDGELYDEVLVPAGVLPASFSLPTGADE